MTGASADGKPERHSHGGFGYEVVQSAPTRRGTNDGPPLVFGPGQIETTPSPHGMGRRGESQLQVLKPEQKFPPTKSSPAIATAFLFRASPAQARRKLAVRTAWRVLRAGVDHVPGRRAVDISPVRSPAQRRRDHSTNRAHLAGVYRRRGPREICRPRHRRADTEAPARGFNASCAAGDVSTTRPDWTASGTYIICGTHLRSREQARHPIRRRAATAFQVHRPPHRLPNRSTAAVRRPPAGAADTRHRHQTQTPDTARARAQRAGLPPGGIGSGGARRCDGRRRPCATRRRLGRATGSSAAR